MNTVFIVKYLDYTDYQVTSFTEGVFATKQAAEEYAKSRDCEWTDEEWEASRIHIDDLVSESPYYYVYDHDYLEGAIKIEEWLVHD